MQTIEIYWQDLTKKKREELLQLLGDNRNWDVFPLATIDIEDDEEVEPEYTVPAEFVSEWDDYYTVTSPCRVNPVTKEVTDIAEVDASGFENLTREYIILDGEEHNVFQQSDLTENEDEYWYQA